jgi:folylpolyglutamate synthase
MTMQRKFADRWKGLSSSHPSSQTSIPTQIKVLPCLEEAFTYIQSIGSEVEDKSEKNDERKVRVFITGSIHLVGRALSLLEGGDAS